MPLCRLCFISLLAVGCLLEPNELSLEIRVSVRTGGRNQDADGYTVSLDGRVERPFAANGDAAFDGLNEYDHTVTLRGVAGNCRVRPANPVTVSMASDISFFGLPTYTDQVVEFLVDCDWNGSLNVTTVTTGTNIDPDGYVLTRSPCVEWCATGLWMNGSRFFGPWIAEPISLQLGGLAPNCTLAGDNPRAVVLVHGLMVETLFEITCA